MMKCMTLLTEESGVDLCAGTELDIHVVELDLADLQSVASFAKRADLILHGRPLDLLVSTWSIKQAHQ